MRKLSADYIYPISSAPVEKGILIINDDNRIAELLNKDAISDNGDIEHFEGVLCPGFINTHCHLELSHMRGVIAEKTGLMGFIGEVISKRNNFSEEQIQQAIADAEAEMIKNGIVAVGDISNKNSTFAQKSKKNIYYHTFIEAFDLDEHKADETFNNALEVLEQLMALNAGLTGSIVPHAPYSVSNKLFELINEHAVKNNGIISMHNQECDAENELFKTKQGAFFDGFTKMGLALNYIQKTGISSLQSTFHKLPLSQKILLVHNTITNKQDLDFIQHYLLTHNTNTPKETTKNIYWCTCPNANLYIEGKLPDYSIFINSREKVTIGTDSLTSNWSLSVLDELKTISKHNPQIPLNTLLTWATQNGAEFLGLQDMGSFSKNKKPGINLITNSADGKITANSAIKKIS